MTAFTREQLDALIREASMMNSARSFGFGFDRAAGSDRTAFYFRDPPPPPPPPRKPSKFDGPDVLDLVRGADGVFHLPSALEHRARAL